MTHTPDSITFAHLIYLDTGEAIPLETKAGSYCHFVPDSRREQFGCYEIRFRLDWSDCNADGDPALDADLFDSDGNQLPKAKRASILGASHHSYRSRDGPLSKYVYTFHGNGIKLKFITQLGRVATQTGRVRIETCQQEVQAGRDSHVQEHDGQMSG